MRKQSTWPWEKNDGHRDSAESPFPPHRLRARTEFDSGRDDVYVFDIVQCKCGTEGTLIAAAGSTNSINVYSIHNLQLINQISGHQRSEGTLSSLEYASQQLWSASTDGTVRSWDVRSSTQKATCVLQGIITERVEGSNKEPFNCISIDSTGNLLAGGTDKVGEDASIYIWDIRSGRVPVGHFSESHNDDVTQVVFSPTSPNHLASGSTDGLVCLYDVSTMQEDEAIQSVKNSESSVATIGFFGPNSKYVYCTTHQETFCVWNISEAEPISIQDNVKEKMVEKYGVEIDYLVDCQYQPSNERLFLFSGDHSGGLHVLHANLKEMQPIGLLAGGHSSTVRSVLWNVEEDILLSGGEDGIVCLWKRVV